MLPLAMYASLQIRCVGVEGAQVGRATSVEASPLSRPSHPPNCPVIQRFDNLKSQHAVLCLKQREGS
jgi:hypothetical protein